MNLPIREICSDKYSPRRFGGGYTAFLNGKKSFGLCTSHLERFPVLFGWRDIHKFDGLVVILFYNGLDLIQGYAEKFAPLVDKI